MSYDFDAEKFIDEVEKRPQLYDSFAEDYKIRAVTRNCWSEVGEIMFPDEWSSLSTCEKRTRMKLLIRKWKTLRDNFVREYKGNLFEAKKKETKRRKKYSFYDRLQFLRPYIGGQAATARLENIVACDLEFSADSEIGYENGDPLIITHGDETYDESLIVQDLEGEPDVKPDIDGLDQSQSLSSGIEESFPQPVLSLGKRSSSRVVALKSKKNAIRRSVSVTAAKTTSEDVDDIYGHKAFMMSYIPILNNMPLHAAMQARMQISQVISASFLEYSSQPTPTSSRADSSDAP